jgi:hypothetical protein
VQQMSFNEIFELDVENSGRKKAIRGLRNLLDLFGCFPIVEHWRDGIKIGEYPIGNGVTNVGKNSILDIYFNSGTQIASSSWVIGLIDNSGFTALAASDTMGSHAGWTEFTGYSQSTRVAWGQGSASSQTVTNGTPGTFDCSSSGTVNGIFITSNSTKGGTSGLLWSNGSFGAPVPVVSGDSLKISYSIAC